MSNLKNGIINAQLEDRKVTEPQKKSYWKKETHETPLIYFRILMDKNKNNYIIIKPYFISYSQFVQNLKICTKPIFLVKLQFQTLFSLVKVIKNRYQNRLKITSRVILLFLSSNQTLIILL